MGSPFTHTLHPSTKVGENRLGRFGIILLTHKQTDAGENITYFVRWVLIIIWWSLIMCVGHNIWNQISMTFSHTDWTSLFVKSEPPPPLTSLDKSSFPHILTARVNFSQALANVHVSVCVWCLLNPSALLPDDKEISQTPLGQLLWERAGQYSVDDKLFVYVCADGCVVVRWVLGASLVPSTLSAP